MCLSLALVPSVKSGAEDVSGEQAAAVSEQQDENSQRLEEVTGMDEDGSVYDLDDSKGTVKESGFSLFSRSASVQVVNFRTKGNAVTEYKEVSTGTDGYTNGAYGADAAYLGTSGGKVKFMLSGVVGLVDADEVQVVKFSSVKSISNYKVSGGRLYHYISQNLSSSGQMSTLDNGPAPSYLKSGVTYYSYDGHYFYTDYGVMLEDYQNNSRADSVNPKNPYYNYYQYLPLRSQSGYDASQLDSMINSKVSSSSSMKGKGSSFVEYQNTYGVNALLMTGIAANESAWGTSNICKTKNNLFGLNAVDSTPGTSANTYASVDECIRQFAGGWMSRQYLNPSNWKYKGSFLGNKASGINVSYASDPYWGEKAANVVWTLDSLGGGADSGKYTLAIKDTISTSHNSVNVRNEASTASNILYKTGGHSSYSVLILDAKQSNGFYRIQSDAVLSSDRQSASTGNGEYSFEKMYAYIAADYVTVVNSGSAQAPEPEPEPVVSKVTLNPAEIDLETGANQIFGVAVTGTGNPSQEVIWSVEGAKSADTVISENGMLKIGSDETAEQLVVKAVSAVDETKYASAVVTVKQKEAEVPDTEEPDDADSPDETENPDGIENPDHTENQDDTKVPDSSDDSVEEIKEDEYGIWVKGELAPDARLTVEPVTEDSENYSQYIEPVKNHTILGVYDISLVSEKAMENSVLLGFDVDKQYENEEVIILHYVEKDGEVFAETYTEDENEEPLTVKDGKVSIEVSGFSPYVIAFNDEKSDDDSNRNPDNSTPDGDGTVDPANGNDAADSSEGTPVGNGYGEKTDGNGAADISEGTLNGKGSGDTTPQSSAAKSDGETGNTVDNGTKKTSDEVKKAVSGQIRSTAAKAETPKTGDTGNMAVWLALLAAAGVVIIAVIVIRKKKQSK